LDFKHPYLNIGQTLTVNSSTTSNRDDNYRVSGFVHWPFFTVKEVLNLVETNARNLLQTGR
jgi:hypothetical protein